MTIIILPIAYLRFKISLGNCIKFPLYSLEALKLLKTIDDSPIDLYGQINHR